MTPLIAQILRSRWLAVVVHVGLWLLVYLALTRLGGRSPAYRAADGSAPPVQIQVPVGKLDRLFAVASWPRVTSGTNTKSAFFTQYFTPAPAPAPPPPTTKKIELTYLGYYYTEQGKKQTMVKLGEAFLVTPEGGNVTANLFASEVSVMSLTVTNTAGKTNLLALNKKQEVEVPIK